MIRDFLYKYYIDPIRFGQPYNLVDTLTYAILLIASVYLVYRWLQRAGIRINERLILSTLPYVLFGGLLRVVEDTGMIESDVRFLLVTPLIFVVVFLVTVLSLFFTTALEKGRVVQEYEPLYRGIGILLVLVTGGILIRYGVLYSTVGIPEAVIILTLTGGSTLALWGALRFLARWEFVQNPLYTLLIAGHMLDASATSYGIDLHAIPYQEVHVVGSTLIDLTGTAFSMFLLKLAVIIPAVYILEQYRKEGNQELWCILLLAMITLGLAPGTRDMARMVLYV